MGDSFTRALSTVQRRRFIAQGQVQGVGFRPFVFTLAEECALSGFVRNSPRGVVIEVQGRLEALEAFSDALVHRLPPLARITSLTRETVSPLPDEQAFTIAQSTAGDTHAVLISPDIAVCADCLADMAQGRRSGYPFTSCTNCGPRYTITRSIPYDRQATSMACFPLCASCREEYENPRDRRFHAQPNACPACGPQVWFVTKAEGNPGGAPPLRTSPPGGMIPPGPPRFPLAQVQRAESSDEVWNEYPIAGLARFLADGGIAAIKGLGGFHLSCDAANDEAVRELRRRKTRPHKAFALMAPDMTMARRLVHVSEEAEALLTSPEHPIVLCPRRKNSGLSPAIAPDTKLLGLMLPYTPLHHVLFEEYVGLLRDCRTGDDQKAPLAALVMTSGNRKGEPICLGNREALRELADLADAWLLHDRDILIRVDDSVVRPVPGVGDILYRRARGYVPRPLACGPVGRDTSSDGKKNQNPWTNETKKPLVVLGVGAELKNTLCLTKGDDAFVSQHIGDMSTLETVAFHQEIRAHLETLLMVRPQLVVRDLHPDYSSSSLAEESGLPVLTLQHHFAHAHAVLAENHHPGPALALTLDGTGLGDDGTLWGGEFLYVEPQPAQLDPVERCPVGHGPVHRRPVHQRMAHFAPMRLPGGEAAIREPWRIAHALLLDLGLPLREEFLPWLPEQAATAELLPAILARRVNCPISTSCGRLFDAVSALLGLCSIVSYEGQAAILLENAQEETEAVEGESLCGTGDLDAPHCPDRYTADMRLERSTLYTAPACRIFDSHSLFADVYNDVLRKVPVAKATRRFHAGLAAGLAAMAADLAKECGVRHVGLSGGCLQNATLAADLARLLRAKGLEPLTHTALPPGDGCISFGQAVYGRLLSNGPL